MSDIQVPIPESLYHEAVRAAKAGNLSVQEFVVSTLRERLQRDPDDFDHLFTPEVTAELDVAAAEVRSGRSYTGEQVDEFLAKNRKEWLANHQG